MPPKSRKPLTRGGGGQALRYTGYRQAHWFKYIYIYRRAHLREEGKERTMVFFTQSAVEPTGERKKIVIGDLPKRPPWLETYQLTAAWTCRPLLFTPNPSPTITVSHACKRECMRPPRKGYKSAITIPQLQKKIPPKQRGKQKRKQTVWDGRLAVFT